jgi:hypothetical protein
MQNMSSALTTTRPTLASPHAMAPAARSPMAPPCAPLRTRRGVVVRAMAAEQAGAGLNKFSARITQPKSQGASQAMLYATGMDEDDMNKPQVREPPPIVPPNRAVALHGTIRMRANAQGYAGHVH